MNGMAFIPCFSDHVIFVPDFRQLQCRTSESNQLSWQRPMVRVQRVWTRRKGSTSPNLQKIHGRFYALELGALGELATTCETKFSVSINFATIISSPVPCCIPFRNGLRAAGKAENADVKHMEKIVPLITCQIALCQFVCELVFGVDIFDLDLWVQTDSVK